MAISTSGEPFKLGRMKCIRETEKALLVEGKLRDGKHGELWAPKSVLHATNKVKAVGDVGTFVVKAWWGKEHL